MLRLLRRACARPLPNTPNLNAPGGVLSFIVGKVVTLREVGCERRPAVTLCSTVSVIHYVHIRLTTICGGITYYTWRSLTRLCNRGGMSGAEKEDGRKLGTHIPR